MGSGVEVGGVGGGDRQPPVWHFWALTLFRGALTSPLSLAQFIVMARLLGPPVGVAVAM